MTDETKSIDRETYPHGETSYLGKSGFLSIFTHVQNQNPEGDNSSDSAKPEPTAPSPSRHLLFSFMDTYLEFCYTWCPILEREDIFKDPGLESSSLLKQALALLGSQINPPLLKHETPAKYYENAKSLFYGNYERDPLCRITAVMLMYWWSAGPPNIVSMDSQFWWTGIAVKLAQEIGLHRDPSKDQVLRPGETAGLRRRIWWTLFVCVPPSLLGTWLTHWCGQARERLTSICQGRPYSINPSDCNVRPLTLEDFPAGKSRQGEIFIHWVRLCEIVGRVARHLNSRTDWQPVPGDISKDLVAWVTSLPQSMVPPFQPNAGAFDREVNQLFLPYLSVITLLYMKRLTQPLPKAYTAGILAASCVARIFEDFLARGTLRFLQGVAGWSIAIAILALLHARRVECLKEHAEQHLEILFTALKEMANHWHSSKMFVAGFESLTGSDSFMSTAKGRPDTHPPPTRAEPDDCQLDYLVEWDGVSYLDYFPGASAHTSAMFNILLKYDPPNLFSDILVPNDVSMQYQDLFDGVWLEQSYDVEQML
ncbi:hypothetical protein FOPE_11629 [Fonsecaea pedrosoi]|nr:hypothetical protein FOPE_11629 [Fonsecaea pedrosoi]